MKNLTLLSSLLGTWSTWTHLLAHIPGLGRYEVMAYFVVHFVPDPTRQNNACDPTDENHFDCNEWDNQYCQYIHEEFKHAQPKCFNMTDNPHIVSDWSDINAYYYIGISMSAGFPFNFDNEHRDTGGWIGPYSIILAHKENKKKPTPSQSSSSTASSISYTDTTTDNENNNDDDTYAIRYVRTFSTPHLHRYPSNQTLFPYEGYLLSFASEAVTATIQQQATIQHGQDPFIQQHATCKHGNITPILPLYQFTKKNKTKVDNIDNDNIEGDDDNDDDDDDDDIDDWDVQVDYRSLISPSTENLAYKWMPWIQKQVNKRGLGFTVDGPYCYFDDPNRAWTVSVSMDTMMMTDEYNNNNQDDDLSLHFNEDDDINNDSAMSSLLTASARRRKQQQQQQASSRSSSSRVLNIVHACVEGLPCIPPNVMSTFYNDGPSSHNSNHHHGMVPNEALNLDSGFIIWCIISIVVLFVTSIIACTCCICRGRRHKRIIKSLLRRVYEIEEELGRGGDALLVHHDNVVNNDMSIEIAVDDDDAIGDVDGIDDNNDPGNANKTNETPPSSDAALRVRNEKSISKHVTDDPLLFQPLLSSHGPANTALSEQNNKKPVHVLVAASTTTTAADAIAATPTTSNTPQAAAMNKRQGQEIV